MLSRQQQGFSALLLIQILCGMAVVAAILIPLINSYRDGEKMRAANLHYRAAIDMVADQHVADRIRRSTGDDSTSSPDDTAAWITLFSKANPQAPGGGPAFGLGLRCGPAAHRTEIVVYAERPCLVGGLQHGERAHEEHGR